MVRLTDHPSVTIAVNNKKNRYLGLFWEGKPPFYNQMNKVIYMYVNSRKSKKLTPY